MKSDSASISYSKFIVLLIILAFLSACASGVSKSVKVTDDDVAKYNVMTPTEAINSLEKEMQTAKDQNLPLYTPKHYKEADSLLNAAKKDIEKKKKKADIIRKIAKADRVLAKAKIMKKEVESELGELLTINSNLINLEAPQVFSKDYKSLKKDLTALTIKVEKNKAHKIEKSRTKLLKQLIALEIKSIKHAALKEANKIKAQAKKKNALKLAPKTYANAVTIYQASEATISQEPHNKENVAKASESAVFAAKHALNVTERVIELQKQYKKSPESVIIEEENRILNISKAINDSDFRDQQINEQITLLIETIDKLNSDNKNNEENSSTIATMEKELAEKVKSQTALSKELDKAKTDLAERNNQMIKMTADLIHLQNKEKELLAEITQLKSTTAKTSNKEIEDKVATAEKNESDELTMESQQTLKEEIPAESENLQQPESKP